MDVQLLVACTTQNAAALLARNLRLHGRGDPAIAAQAVEITHAQRALAVMRPDVAILDHDPGLHLLPLLAQASPRTRILLLEGGDAPAADAGEMVRRGAAGSIAPGTAPALVAKAVRSVAAGGNWFGRTALLDALRLQVGTAAPEGFEIGRLTHREEEVLHLIGQGLSNKEIGRRLEISDNTVKTHLHRVYAKLHRSGRYKAFLAQPGA